MGYLVKVLDKKDFIGNTTICKTNEELATLLLHLKKDTIVERVDVLLNFYSDYKEICKKPDKMELGKQED